MDDLVKRSIMKITRFIKIDINEHMMENLIQFVMFGIVGVSNAIIHYLTNILVLVLLCPFGISWDYMAGNIVAFLLSVLWSFYWNNRIVFTQKEGQQRNLCKALLKAYFAYGFTGIILNNILSWLWISIFYISKYIAPLINLVISVPLNFVINKLWTFKAE